MCDLHVQCVHSILNLFNLAVLQICTAQKNILSWTCQREDIEEVELHEGVDYAIWD